MEKSKYGLGNVISGKDGSWIVGGSYSVLSGGYGCKLIGGEYSLLSCFNGQCKAGKGSVITIANRDYDCENGEFYLTDFVSAIVDGEKIKADTWYKLENGELVECSSEEIDEDENPMDELIGKIIELTSAVQEIIKDVHK